MLRTVIVVTMCLCIQSQFYPVIQVTDFTCCKFKLFDDSTGFIGFINFLATGKIKVETTHPNVFTAWSMGTDRIPIIYGIGTSFGSIAVRFVNSHRDHFAKWRLSGRAFDNTFSYITNYYLEQII